jgi:hypothetical protein
MLYRVIMRAEVSAARGLESQPRGHIVFRWLPEVAGARVLLKHATLTAVSAHSNRRERSYVQL